MKILLIEDDPQFVKIVEAAVATLPTELIHCDTGKAGLKRVEDRDIDLCIVDGLLPDKQGVRIIEAIKAMRAITEPKVVFLSAFFNDVRTFRKLTALGVDLVLSKPITAADLKQRLSAFMPKNAAKPAPKTPDVGFAASFARLKEDYVEKLRHLRAPEFAQLIHRAEKDDPSSIDEIRSFCHKVRGTAGSYGLGHITEAAARLENGVDYYLLSRLLPEMRQFLALLSDASLDARKPVVEHVSDIGLATLFRSLLIVAELPLVYTRVKQALGEEQLDIRQASTLDQAIRSVVTLQPDLLIVDTASIDDRLNKSFIEVLLDLKTGIPVLAFGPPIHDLPADVVSVPMASRRPRLVSALRSPELRPYLGATALLCDEHENVATQVNEVLVPLGVTIERATSASDVQARVGASVPTGAVPGPLPDEVQLPDVILMDVDFASRSGIGLAKQIRATLATPPSIVFLSEQSTLAERTQSYQAGAEGYVLKPMANEQLARAVTQILRQRRTAQFTLNQMPIRKPASPGAPVTVGSRTKTLTLDRPEPLFPGAQLDGS